MYLAPVEIKQVIWEVFGSGIGQFKTSIVSICNTQEQRAQEKKQGYVRYDINRNYHRDYTHNHRKRNNCNQENHHNQNNHGLCFKHVLHREKV